MSVRLSLGTLTDADLFALRKALDELGRTPAPSPVPAPPDSGGGKTTFPAWRLGPDDKFYLYRMVGDYASALKSLPGTHELHYDVLTDAVGHRYSDAVPQPPGTTRDPSLKLAISRAINFAGSDHAAEVYRWNVSAYAGPLKEIVANLVAAKLAGRA